jgi:hypothetical protein
LHLQGALVFLLLFLALFLYTLAAVVAEVNPQRGLVVRAEEAGAAQEMPLEALELPIRVAVAVAQAIMALDQL